MSHLEAVEEPGQGTELIASYSEGNHTQAAFSPPSEQDSPPYSGPVLDLLFQDVVFYLNPFLGRTKSTQFKKILCEHGAQETRSTFARETHEDLNYNTRPTHIITEDLDFPDHNHATARGIHVVTPAWITRSVNCNKQLNPKHFSADPSMIFSGVILTATGLPPYDREIIGSAVEDYGGAFTNYLSADVTHMIAVAPEGEKYEQAMEHPEWDIKIVLPHWFQQSCNLKRRLPETIYRFPNPPMLDQSFVAPPEMVSGKAPQLYSNTIKAVTLFLMSPSKFHSKFLRRFRFHLVDDLNILPERKTYINQKIIDAGGTLVNEYSSETVDVVICRFRAGNTYIQASRDGKIVGSADWLFHILQTGELSSPKASLLHYPIPPEPIPGMSSFIMTVTQYTGNVREYLKRMIIAVGATYKPTLASQNAPEPTTHIICGNSSGEKYERGQEWNVKVVNHLWLEDCFQVWSLQSESKPRYTQFPPFNQLPSIFGANILQETVDEWLKFYEEDTSSPIGVMEAGEQIPSLLAEKTFWAENQDSTYSQRQIEGGHASSYLPNDKNVQSDSSTLSSKPVFNKSTLKDRLIESEISTPTSSAPSSPTTRQPYGDISEERDKNSSRVTPIEDSSSGSVRTISRKRGAAVQANKALQKIVPDMNEFQEELKDAKKAMKRKKKRASSQEPKDGEDEDMNMDETSAPLSATRNATAPSKRSRISIGSVGERSTPGATDDEEPHDNETTMTESKSQPKKTKRGTKAEKDGATGESTVPENVITSGKSRRVRYISTGVKEQSAAQVKALKALGILPATSAEKCTHLIATGISRTGKFLIALLHGKIIVHEDWLQACVDANTVLDENDFRIKDTKTEQKLNMDLYKSVERAREKRVFENCVFYISPSLNKDMPGLKAVVEAGGGKASPLLHTGLGVLKDRLVKVSNDKDSFSKDGDHEKRLKTRRKVNQGEGIIGRDDGEDNESVDKSEDESIGPRDEIVAVVSSEKDRDMWQSIVDAGAHVYSHDLISVSVLTQRLDLGDTHALA
ncbi:hypothetical protein BCR41DRAFT_360843 [Lobosporangium transversale]|uniref:BRCT domain-containing protein n=1 Tax=Lobosporangium transversale TaxID=64571 RepID=A0A1Y2GD54_9FUNG|nr:hypothetical protein BCR41DRAFT_360843 [Lobosporangium transversale]ORZ06550.1 hypothetical protein BCR41DRAFT_360843 [Lobosporangium transversale]|eukprot:XP_021877593.1 hypothetical protein BCR41DRAFT_360843 [Lobosporangium transversale]